MVIFFIIIDTIVKREKMENSRAAVWKCGGRQNKNSVAGDELQKTQQNEEIDGCKKWKLLGKRAAAFLLGAVMAVNPGLAGTAAESLLGIVSYAEERTASVNATNLNVRSGPGTSYQALAKLSKGAPVTVLGEQTGTDGVVWYQIRYSGTAVSRRGMFRANT
mgnify:CR=1 FL=1